MKQLKDIIRLYNLKFKNNIRGYPAFFQSEINAIPLTFVSICNIILGILLNYNRYDWALIIFSFAMMWCAELLNTAIEKVVDIASPQYSDLAKHAKDIAGAGVMVASFTTIAVFIAINWERFFG